MDISGSVPHLCGHDQPPLELGTVSFLSFIYFMSFAVIDISLLIVIFMR
jgi:hypothetical protein